MNRRLLAALLASLFLRVDLMARDAAEVIQAGPMVGYVDLMETAIWVQTKRAAEVALRYGPKDGPMAATNPVQAGPNNYFTAKFILTDLEPGTVFEYVVTVDGEAVSFDYPLTFKTQTFWQWRTEPPDFQFAIGSCLFVNDPKYDRPGKGYGGNLEILGAIHAKKPDFMLWLGDTTYYREPEYYSVKRMAYRQTHTRSYPGLQPLLASTAHYAVWDDHDFGPNDSNRGYTMKAAALNLFRIFWANPSYGMPDTPGVFFRFQWADVAFFVMDNRYYRAANGVKDPDKPYLGKAQLDWLKDNLTTSYATFKIIVVGNQVTNVHCRHEAYPRFQNEYRELMSWLRQSEVEGVLFLSGDRHFTELLKTERPGAYPLYEFTSSPLSSGVIHDLGDEKNNPLRVPGALTDKVRNFGLVKVSGPREKRVLTLQTYDYQGKLLWEHVVKREELGLKQP